MARAGALLPAVLAVLLLFCGPARAVDSRFITEYIDIYNRPATTVANLVRPLLSERGKVIADDDVNLLVVVDFPENVLQVLELVAQLDKAQKAVTVRATLVRASDRALREIGLSTWGQGSASGMMLFGEGYVAAPQGVLMADVTARFALLESRSIGHSESRAHVTTMSGQPADLRLGVSVPYATSDGWGGTQVTFRDVLLRLTVTPTIRPDGRIDLKVSIADDALMPGGIISTTGSTTRISLKPGEAATIAGSDQTSSLDDRSGIPGASAIPVLGILFGSRSDGEEQTRLVILVSADYN